MLRSRWTAFMALSIGAVALSLWVFSSPVKLGAGGAAAPEKLLAHSPEPSSSPEPREQVQVQPIAPNAPERTVRDFLQSYYGPDWERVREILERHQAGLLSRPLDESNLPPEWADAEAELRNSTLITPDRLQYQADSELGFNEHMYDTWAHVRESFTNVPESVGSAELEAFRELAAPFDGRLRELSVQRVAVVSDIQQFKWESGDFARGPFTCAPKAHEEGRRCVMTLSGTAKNQWTMAMSIFEDELPPAYFELGKQITAEKKKRTKALNAYLNGL